MKKTLRAISEITVEPVEICDIYEIGNWTKCYPFIKLGYKNDDYESKLSDMSFYIKDKGVILGYFRAYNVVNVDKDDIIPLYSKKMVLYDLAVSARAYAKYGLILIDFLINYAKNNGYKAVEIKKISSCGFFLDFLNRHFKLEEFNDAYYIINNEPKIKPAEKHFLIYDNDNVRIEDIYFLYDMNFSVGKTQIKLKLNDKESISVDRRSGKIKFPSNVETTGDDVVLNSYTKSIIYLICAMYSTDEVKDLRIDYSLAEPNLFEAYACDVLYVNKDIAVLSDDIGYVLNMVDKGIKRIEPCTVGYDMNERSISPRLCRTECDHLIEKYAFNCDSKACGFSEKRDEKKKAKEFNLKLRSIKRFDVCIGDILHGEKKLSIVFNDGDGVEILSNGQKENGIKSNREEIIKELEYFYFTNWKSRYEDNPEPKIENSWSVKLALADEEIAFTGCDDYPRIWRYVERFVAKYGGF